MHGNNAGHGFKPVIHADKRMLQANCVENPLAAQEN